MTGETKNTPRRRMPSLIGRTWNLAKAIAQFVADGCKTVSVDDYRARLNVCDDCESRFADVCLECGCCIAAKAQFRSSECPLAKWPLTEQPIS